MSNFNKALLFFILPVIGILFYQPSTLSHASSIIWVILILFFLLNFFLWKGYSKALTFMIFVNGMNVIVRLMMLLSTAFNKEGVFNLPFTIYGAIGAAISFYLILRLDRVDVRQYMVR